MRNIIGVVYFIFLFVVAGSCAIRPPSATPTGSRTIVIEGDTISEDSVGGFTCWYCKDYFNDGPVLVEVGFIDDPEIDFIGFILYDGGYSGDVAFYQRQGLEHRWNWGPNISDYSFVIKQDGTGLYYDFTTVQEGESADAREVYKCKQR